MDRPYRPTMRFKSALKAYEFAQASSLLKLKSFPSYSSPFLLVALSYSHQPKLQVRGHGAMCRLECLFSSQLAPVPIYTAW